jgi:3-methyladenine DNA glycosylase Tag
MSIHVYNNFFDQETWAKVNPDNKELLDDFMLELKQLKRSKETIKQYRTDLQGFFCYILHCFDNESVLEMTKKDFQRYSFGGINAV